MIMGNHTANISQNTDFSPECYYDKNGTYVAKNQCFFKITNNNECHNGYQYKNGLNILNVEFEPHGSCAIGGLYFTTEQYIFDFLDYGCYLREVYLPEDCMWTIDPLGNKFRSNKIILGQRHSLVDLSTVKMLVEKGADFDNGAILVYASEKGYADIVRYLLEKGANSHLSEALTLASEHGHFEIVKMLVGKIGCVNNRPSLHDGAQAIMNSGFRPNTDLALMAACHAGNLRIVKYLHTHSININVCDGRNLLIVCEKGYIDILEYLVVHRISIKYYHIALELAHNKKQHHIVQYLMMLSKNN